MSTEMILKIFLTHVLIIIDRNRQQKKEETMTKRRVQSDAEHMGRMNRQRIMREFKERQLHCIEILPACKLGPI